MPPQTLEYESAEALTTLSLRTKAVWRGKPEAASYPPLRVGHRDRPERGVVRRKRRAATTLQ